MPKKLILHMGSPKTGTTSIQKFLECNQKAVEGQGFCYPRVDYRHGTTPYSRNAHFLYQLALYKNGIKNDLGVGAEAEKTIERALASLRKCVSKPGEAVILSDETLWQMTGGHKETIPSLKETCDQLGFESYEIVVYLRRQDKFIESMWSQLIKSHKKIGTPKTKTLQEFIYASYAKKTCCYNKILSRLESSFGRENIVVKMYDRKLLKDGDSIADFLDTVGIEKTAAFIEPEEERNPSLKSRALLEVKRQSYYAPCCMEGLNPLNKSIMKVDRTIQDEQKGAGLTPEERKEFLSRYEKGNREIAQRYFGRDELFGPDPVDEMPIWQPAPGEIDRDTLIVLVETLYEQNKRIEELENNRLGKRIERGLRGLLGRPQQVPSRSK